MRALSFRKVFPSVLLFAAILINQVACNSEASMIPLHKMQRISTEAKPLYEAMVAELYNQLGEEQLAVDHYQRLTLNSDDPAVAKRVTILAAVTGQTKKGLKTAKRWVELKPEDLEASQYLALLYLRNNQLKASSKQLQTIRQLIGVSTKKTSPETQGTVTHSVELRFIGALLAAESHHDKSFDVFTLFVAQYGKEQFKVQQDLIAASLAIKAKKYKVVVSLLADLENLDSQNLVDASLTKAKALEKLNRDIEAIQVLELIKDKKETSDSTRLELVRLLVLNKKKKQALDILLKLVEKHNHNNDLLKSLVALQVDQLQWQQASANIQKLRLSKKYRNDVEFFNAEILLGQGKFIRALQSYQKVKGGSFLKNSHKKEIRLTKQLQGMPAVYELLRSRQANATQDKKKAYWLKQEADLFFEDKKYNDALTLYNRIIKLSPKNIRYRYRRGLLNERVGQFVLAEEDFNFVLKTKDNDVDTLNALGYMLTVHTKRYDEAMSHIEKAFKIKPNDPVIMDSLGWVYFQTGDFTSAESYLRKAFSAIKNPEVASHLISTLAKSGKQQEAQEIFNEMNKKYPDNKMLNNVKHYLPGI